ncbi:MAG: hypothetical protein RBT76_06690 [candidate division Zixibacteria bacterium]|jgi:antitoxin component YwqK of YwqJK toxin-antitoxin module|nr:hypothetical protein [candidate division Zixibacteria bacterium]
MAPFIRLTVVVLLAGTVGFAQPDSGARRTATFTILTSATREHEPEPQVYMVEADEGARLVWWEIMDTLQIKSYRPRLIFNGYLSDGSVEIEMKVWTELQIIGIDGGDVLDQSCVNPRVDTLAPLDTALFLCAGNVWIKVVPQLTQEYRADWQWSDGCYWVRVTDTLPPIDSIITRAQYAPEGWLRSRQSFRVMPFGRPQREGVHTEWSGPGRLESEVTYHHDQPDGRMATYWPNGQIKIEQYVRGQVRDGTYRYWHYDGSFGGESIFDDGTGVLKQHYADGTPMIERPFVDGNEHGRFREWYPNGVQSMEGEHEHGTSVGVYRNWFPNGQTYNLEVYEGGKTVAETLWYDDGQLQFAFSSVRFPNTTCEWFENGQMRLLEVRDSSGHRTSRSEWYRNGDPKLEATYDGGMSPATMREWYEDGTLKEIRSIDVDSLARYHATYHPDGRIQREEIDSLQSRVIVVRGWFSNGNPDFSFTHNLRIGENRGITYYERDGSIRCEGEWPTDDTGGAVYYLPDNAGRLVGPISNWEWWEGHWVRLDSTEHVIGQAWYRDGELTRATDSSLFTPYLKPPVRVIPQ